MSSNAFTIKVKQKKPRIPIGVVLKLKRGMPMKNKKREVSRSACRKKVRVYP